MFPVFFNVSGKDFPDRLYIRLHTKNCRRNRGVDYLLFCVYTYIAYSKHKKTTLRSMNMKRFFAIAAVLAALLALSCQVNVNGDDGNGNGNGGGTIDWTDYNSGYSVQVRNQTSHRLIAFKNDVRADALLGGVPAGPTTEAHGLPKNGLFNDNAAFTLILLTEDQYNRNKDNPVNLDAQKNAPFTQIFAFYNAEGSNENAYTISGRLGGNRTILINNDTGWDVELRLNGIDGDTLGYARAGMLQTKLYVNGGEDFFSVSGDVEV
jgi:hypothetical protein